MGTVRTWVVLLAQDMGNTPLKSVAVVGVVELWETRSVFQAAVGKSKTCPSDWGKGVGNRRLSMPFPHERQTRHFHNPLLLVPPQGGGLGASRVESFERLGGHLDPAQAETAEVNRVASGVQQAKD